MPSPVEALPCGSRSTISTRSPTAASAVPRLIAVVVLPTPPFWLATARMRDACEGSGLTASADTMGLLYLQDTPARINHARMFGESESPRFGGFGQFRIDILSFVEKSGRTLVEKCLGM